MEMSIARNKELLEAEIRRLDAELQVIEVGGASEGLEIEEKKGKKRIWISSNLKVNETLARWKELPDRAWTYEAWSRVVHDRKPVTKVKKILAIDGFKYAHGEGINVCPVGDGRHGWSVGEINSLGFSVETSKLGGHGYDAVIRCQTERGATYFLADLAKI